MRRRNTNAQRQERNTETKRFSQKMHLPCQTACATSCDSWPCTQGHGGLFGPPCLGTGASAFVQPCLPQYPMLAIFCRFLCLTRTSLQLGLSSHMSPLLRLACDSDRVMACLPTGLPTCLLTRPPACPLSVSKHAPLLVEKA